MRKGQRYRYDMFVRVRDFGTANRDLIPESSTGGRWFGQVAAAVAAIEQQAKNRDLARIEARKVKTTTRAAVREYMKTLARTARRATRDEPLPMPFVMPVRSNNAALLTAAGVFLEQAQAREAKFVNLGLPATFISEFQALVDRLHDAVEVRNNGQSLRVKAQTGIEQALDDGFEAVRNLDVLVTNLLRDEPVRLGHWRGARHLEGIRSSSASAKTTAAHPPESQPAPEAPAVTTPAAHASDVLMKAS